MSKYKLVPMFFFMFSFLMAQEQAVIFKNAVDMDTERYADIKGNCFLFDDWVSAKLYDKAGTEYKDILVNYNGYESGLEANNEKGQYVVVRPSDICKVVVNELKEQVPEELHFLDSLVFVPSPALGLKADYYLVLHQKNNRHLLLEVSSTVATVTQRPPGQIIENKKFSQKLQLILIDNNRVARFPTKKKAIIKTFEPMGDIAKWTKNNKMKLTSYEALVGFMDSL